MPELLPNPMLFRNVHLPHVVRVGPRASRELSDDAARLGLTRVWVVWSAGLPADVSGWIRQVLSDGGTGVAGECEVAGGTIREAEGLAASATAAGGVLAVGGGRALDVGKYAAALAGVPVICVPTSLSHDGFASPSASLTDADGKRRSLACSGPAGVIVDTQICAAAPPRMFAAGAGDVVAKLTALSDWWLAEHTGHLKVDGVAATVAASAVATFECHATPDARGHELLAEALLLGGVAMGVAGCSRPCSGSEHLVSHALDRLRTPPGSHGLQVGLAAYVLSQIQTTDAAATGGVTARIARTLTAAGTFDAARDERIPRDQFIEALRLAPGIKADYPTVLSRPGAVEAAERVVHSDPILRDVLV